MRKLPDNVRVSAQVRLTVDIDVSDCWGGDCPMSQVYRQAADVAIARVNRELNGVKFIGEPEVFAVVASAGGAK